MNLVVYNINSFGGNYEYIRYLYKAYLKNPDIDSCTMLMPANAVLEEPGVKKILKKDLIESKNKWVKRFNYIYRSLINPYRLYFFLKKQPPSVVLFNDYDQITAWFWAPLFMGLKKRHKFAVMLHDPDRDKFFPWKALSDSSMEQVMKFMDVGLYHGFLPEKTYYKDSLVKAVVPQGIYDDLEVDQNYFTDIKQQAGDNAIIGILGNIRDEKNYSIIIESLPMLDNVKLLISGKAANSGVSLETYKQFAAEKGVYDKIIWKEGYVSQSAFNAAILSCDIVLLYYKPSFISQSAVLNSIAPFNRKLIISDAESSLKKLVKQYGLGKIVPVNNAPLLAEAVKELLQLPPDYAKSGWDAYVNDSSWDTNAKIAVETYKKVL